MNATQTITLKNLSHDYAVALSEHIRDAGEVTLQKAYELGRKAIASGAGLLDIAAIYQTAVTEILLHTPKADEAKLVTKSFEFYSETLAVFEMVQRGYQQALENIRQLNSELVKSVDQFKAVNKELETFSYSVSHDLRAPLRIIIGYADALIKQYESVLDLQGKDYLNRVIAGTEQMGDLIDSLLALSKISREELKKTNIDLSKVVKGVVAELIELEPHRQVEIVIEEGVFVDGDELLLRAALGNLFRNAWKFTSKSGAAKIEFATLDKEGKRIFFVRDNGAGFDMKHIDKLFGVFQRLHSPTQFEGTGIGLATVQRIMHRHGGSIWAEAKIDLGATFYFTL
jgi:light-regulated signal transduction histidine kinase (bacteriophytochrome)